MANKIVCDICGNECEDKERYQLIYRKFFNDFKRDICKSCILKIEKSVKNKEID